MCGLYIERWSYAIGWCMVTWKITINSLNVKRSLIPWGLRVPIWKMNFCSRVLRLSVLPWCRERPQTAICCLEWFGRLKCLATGLDAFWSSFPTSRRCSRKRSPNRLPVSPMYNFSQRVQVMQYMTLAEVQVKRSVILTERLGPDIFSTLRMEGTTSVASYEGRHRSRHLYLYYRRAIKVRNFCWHQTVQQQIEGLKRKSHTKPGYFKPSNNFQKHLDIHQVHHCWGPRPPLNDRLPTSPRTRHNCQRRRSLQCFSPACSTANYSTCWSLQSYSVKRIPGLFRQNWPVPWGSISHWAHWQPDTSHTPSTYSSCSHPATVLGRDRENDHWRHHYGSNRTHRMGQFNCLQC